MLIIQRNNESNGSHKECEVYMNGLLTGRLKANQYLSLQVPAGQHNIYIKIDQSISPSRTIIVEDGIDFLIECESKIIPLDNNKYTLELTLGEPVVIPAHGDGNAPRYANNGNANPAGQSAILNQPQKKMKTGFKVLIAVGISIGVGVAVLFIAVFVSIANDIASYDSVDYSSGNTSTVDTNLDSNDDSVVEADDGNDSDGVKRPSKIQNDGGKKDKDVFEEKYYVTNKAYEYYGSRYIKVSIKEDDVKLEASSKYDEYIFSLKVRADGEDIYTLCYYRDRGNSYITSTNFGLSEYSNKSEKKEKIIDLQVYYDWGN